MKTNINGTLQTGKHNGKGKDRINEVLAQALTKAQIEEETITLGNDFQKYCKKVSGNYVIDFNKYDEIKKYLESKRDLKYENHYKIYFFNEDGDGVNGYSYGQKYTVCFDSHGQETPIHELLHALELPHPFDAYSRNTKFTYEFIKTDNVMDYGHHVAGLQRKSLFHWQWQIINLKIR